MVALAFVDIHPQACGAVVSKQGRKSKVKHLSIHKFSGMPRLGHYHVPSIQQHKHEFLMGQIRHLESQPFRQVQCSLMQNREEEPIASNDVRSVDILWAICLGKTRNFVKKFGFIFRRIFSQMQPG